MRRISGGGAAPAAANTWQHTRARSEWSGEPPCTAEVGRAKARMMGTARLSADVPADATDQPSRRAALQLAERRERGGGGVAARGQSGCAGRCVLQPVGTTRTPHIIINGVEDSKTMYDD